MQIARRPYAFAENRRARRARIAQERREQRRKKRQLIASPIISAWIALAGVNAYADDLAMPQSEARIRYMYYTEHQSDGTERMTINAPMAFLRQRVDENTALEGTFTYDGMTGASPFYLDSVSGASGLGIKDDRYEGQLRATRRFNDTIVGGTFFLSDEDDYKSVSGTIDATHSLEGGNTQFSAAVSHASDEVSCTLYPLLGGNRETTSVSAGIIQVVDEISVFSSSLAYTIGTGYLTDPYKSFDNRPEERNAFVWMNRLNHYFEKYDSALHSDLRLYSDDWGITSQTVEFAYYQPIWDVWLLRPSIRYYSQHGATFFKDVFPPSPEQTGYYTADQRLGTYGSFTIGLKLQRDFGNNWLVDVGGHWMEQRTEWSLQGGSGSNFQALHAFFTGVGVLKRF